MVECVLPSPAVEDRVTVGAAQEGGVPASDAREAPLCPACESREMQGWGGVGSSGMRTAGRAERGWEKVLDKQSKTSTHQHAALEDTWVRE